MIDYITDEILEKKVGAPRGQKRPLRPREVWAIRARIEISNNVRNLALFNLAIDSKLRGCDLVRLKVSDMYSAGAVRERAMIVQKKTGKPVQMTKLTAASVLSQIKEADLISLDPLFPSRQKKVSIYQPDIIIVSFSNGSLMPDWKFQIMALTHCVGRKLRNSIELLAT